jgi:hypothetical protein
MTEEIKTIEETENNKKLLRPKAGILIQSSHKNPEIPTQNSMWKLDDDPTGLDLDPFLRT